MADKIQQNKIYSTLGSSNHTEKEYLKSPNDSYTRVEKSNGEILYFVPSETARGYCLDDGTVIPLKELFTAKAFTKERLERLDEFIKSEFKYADGTNPEDVFNDENEDEPDEDVPVSDMIKNQLD